MSQIETTEDLNILLSYIMPIDMEEEFLLEISRLYPRPGYQIDLEFYRRNKGAKSVLMAARYWISSYNTEVVRNSLEYLVEERAYNRAKLFEATNSAVQKIFDLRKSYLMRLPALERELLERIV